jgi:hypothetical protein
LYELFAFARCYVIKAAARFFDSVLLKQPQKHPVPLGGSEITFLVVAIAKVASQDQHPISSLFVGLKYELGIDSPAAHHLDHPDVGRVRDLGKPGLVCARVRAPVAQEADNLGLECIIPAIG